VRQVVWWWRMVHAAKRRVPPRCLVVTSAARLVRCDDRAEAELPRLAGSLPGLACAPGSVLTTKYRVVG
jgi:hypothetical protein